MKAYKYCLLPTEAQKIWFIGLFGACRFVYNLGLEVKSTAWKSAGVDVSSYELMRQLTELKHTECQWLKEYPAQSLESSLTNLDSAYSWFFKRGGFPNFKNKHGRQSATFRKSTTIKDGKVRLSKIGWVDFVEHRKMPEGEIRSVVVSKETTGKYFVSILLKDSKHPPAKPPVITETTIGIDVGLKSFACLSDGQTIENPKYFQKQLRRLRVERRKLARRFKNGAKEQSKNYQKQKQVVAKLHEKIGNRRKDFLQKTSTGIIRQYDTICVEDLNISGLKQNKNLAISVSDVGWYEFIQMLEYKSVWYGKNIIKIGRFDPSSKTCSECGYIYKELILSERTWQCENCGTRHDRDLNAAINIKNFGLKAEPSTAKTSQQAISMGCESLPLAGAGIYNNLIIKNETMTIPNNTVAIPEDIQKKMDVHTSWAPHEVQAKESVEYGYSLAIEQLAERDKIIIEAAKANGSLSNEVDRLKRLIEDQFRRNHKIYRNQNSSMTDSQIYEETESLWQQFKQKHLL